jgi:hypothetical protein
VAASKGGGSLNPTPPIPFLGCPQQPPPPHTHTHTHHLRSFRGTGDGVLAGGGKASRRDTGGGGFGRGSLEGRPLPGAASVLGGGDVFHTPGRFGLAPAPPPICQAAWSTTSRPQKGACGQNSTAPVGPLWRRLAVDPIPPADWGTRSTRSHLGKRPEHEPPRP